MSTLVDLVSSAAFHDGQIVVIMKSGIEIRVPVARNPRHCNGTPEQLNNIEVSPFGLHWPDLDEDVGPQSLQLSNGFANPGACAPSLELSPRDLRLRSRFYCSGRFRQLGFSKIFLKRLLCRNDSTRAGGICKLVQELLVAKS